MHTKRPISEQLALTILDQFVVKVNAFNKSKDKIKELKEIQKNYDAGLNMLDSIKLEKPALYNIIALLLHYNLYQVDESQLVFKHYCREAIHFVTTISKAEIFPEAYLAWPNHVVAILSKISSDNIQTYRECGCQSELVMLGNVRSGLKKFLDARNGKGEFVDQNAKILLGSLYYVTSFVKTDVNIRLNNKNKNARVNQLKSQVNIKEFLNKEAFDQFNALVYKQLSCCDLSDAVHQCVACWFRIYKLNTEWAQEYRLKSNVMNIQLVLQFLENMNKGIIALFEAIRESYNEYFLIDKHIYGINIFQSLMDEAKIMINRLDDKVSSYINTLDERTIDDIMKNPLHPLRNKLFDLLQLKIILFDFKNALYAYSHPVNMINNNFKVKSKEIDQQEYDYALKTCGAMLFDKTRYVAQYPVKLQELISMENEELAIKSEKKQPFNVKESCAARGIQNSLSQASKNQAKNNTSINPEEKITNLMNDRLYQDAIEQAEKWRGLSCSTNNYLAMVKASNFLGDAYYARSASENVDAGRVSLKISKEHYEFCIATINKMLDRKKPYSSDVLETMRNTRNYLLFRLHSPEYSECKPQSEVKRIKKAEIELKSSCPEIIEIEAESKAVEEKTKPRDIETMETESDDSTHSSDSSVSNMSCSDAEIQVTMREQGIPSISKYIYLPEYVNKKLDVLEGAGYQAFLVGGAVRDFLVTKDYDIVTTAPMNEISRLFDGWGCIIGKSHPVFNIPANIFEKEIQISTLASNADTAILEQVLLSNGHVATVRRGSDIREDAKTRVLTINALYYDRNKSLILDPCKEGIEDLCNKSINFISAPGENKTQVAEAAIRKDPALIFRILRLIARHDHVLNDEYQAVIRNNIQFLRTLNQENSGKVNNEISKTLMDCNVNKILCLFWDYHIFSAIYCDDIHELGLIKKIGTILVNEWQFDCESVDLLVWASMLKCSLYQIAKPFLVDRDEEKIKKLINEYPDLFSDNLKLYGLFGDRAYKLARLLLLYSFRRNQINYDTKDIQFDFTEIKMASCLVDTINAQPGFFLPIRKDEEGYQGKQPGLSRSIAS